MSEEAVPALRDLAAGDLAAWRGLPAGVTRADAEAALGAPDPPRDFGGRFAGEPRVFRHHGPAPAAPAGVDVWFSGDDAVAVAYAPAELPAPPDDQLGPPEATVESSHGPHALQLVHARRGLVLHVSRGGAVERVVGFRPCSTEAFLAGPLRRD